MFPMKSKRSVAIVLVLNMINLLSVLEWARIKNESDLVRVQERTRLKNRRPTDEQTMTFTLGLKPIQ